MDSLEWEGNKWWKMPDSVNESAVQLSCQHWRICHQQCFIISFIYGDFFVFIQNWIGLNSAKVVHANQVGDAVSSHQFAPDFLAYIWNI